MEAIKRMTAAVNKKPNATWQVRAVPTYLLSETSLIIVENWAESAMMAMPQISESGMSNAGRWSTTAAKTQQAELTAMAMIVTRARCATRRSGLWSWRRSLAAPAQMQPTAPMAMAMAAMASNIERD